MSDANFNKLTPAQTERLALLSEELGEAIQVIGKILRHGYESYSPVDPKQETNKTALEQELGDVAFAASLMSKANDISLGKVTDFKSEKEQRKNKYLHHN